MRTGNKGQFFLLLLLAAAGVMLVVSRRGLERANPGPGQGAEERDLYLPEAGYLKLVSLGHDGLLADLVLAKSLTYYGANYRRRESFSFRHLKKLFFTAVQLDPLNKEAFLMANNILSRVNVRDANEILHLGMKHHPQYWKFPEMVGFNYFYYLKDPHAAARYYEQAAALPGHPPYVPSLSGKLYQESGRHVDALRVLENFHSTTSDPRLKKSFRQYIDRVKEKIFLKQFQLSARVTAMKNALTLRFQPDRGNPLFTALRAEETLRIVGPVPFSVSSAEKKERLFAFFQRDYARLLLPGKEVKLEFMRKSGGELKRDKGGRLQGVVILSSGRLYQEHAAEIGLYPGSLRFPIPEEYRLPVEQALGRARENGSGWHGFPPEQVPVKDVALHAGRLVSVRFPVNRVEVIGGAVYFHSDAEYRNRFSAVIPVQQRKFFSSLEKGDDFTVPAGKWVTVSGLAVPRGGRIEIDLYLPMQLTVDAREDTSGVNRRK